MLCLLKNYYFIRLNMGVRSSSDFNRDYEQLIDQFEVLQENVGEGLRYLEHKQTKQEYLLREVSYHDKEAFFKYQQLFSRKKTQLDNNRHVLPLVKLISNSQDQFCMTFYKIFALFEFPQRTLDDEINERGLQKRRFQEKQLWSILASCILGMSHLQKNNIRHSSLRSNTILISHDGIIKIFDPITTGCSSNYDTVLTQRQTPHIYLSPQQVEALREEKITVDNQPFKTDIWTMGMIVLEAGLLSYQDECYRDQYARIHWETLQYNINLFQQSYSSELTNLVEFMLGKDERSRPDWFELEQHVIKVEEDVRGSAISQKKPTQQVFQQRKKISRVMDQRTFGAEKDLSSSHTPSEIHLPVTKYTPTKVGITRSKEKSSVAASPQLQVQSNEPIKISDITYTRPLKSVFPSNFYVSNSKIDQNLLIIQDDQQDLDFVDQQRFSVPAAREVAAPQYVATLPFSTPNSQESMYYQHNVTNYRPTEFLYYQPIQVPPSLQTSVHNESSRRTNQEGEFVVEQYKQGSRYEGFKLNGLKHGFGKFYYQDGGRYEGNWKAGKMQGIGKLYYQSDKLAYDGQWHSDQFSGRGTLYNQFPEIVPNQFDYRNLDEVQEYWVRYQGNFVQDMKHGWGVWYLSNGEYFEGEFKNDYADGMGTYVTKQGKKIRGRWKNNVME